MRVHGRNGLAYLSVHAGDPAAPVAYLSSWTAAWARDVSDVTTLADTQRVYVAGLPDVSGTFTGFWDDASSQAYIAATDGLPRSMYLYPDSADMSQYISGLVLPDMTVTGGAGTAVTIAVNWVAAGPVTRTGPGSVYTATYAATY
jgi:hypothetical protein